LRFLGVKVTISAW